MLNIQLFLENKEVELNNKVQFTLNKSFENLWNPTDIIVEYSKSINIPATATNNRIMANAYRIDRQFSASDSTTNIGLYLDPLKRIPMKLIYNGSIILDGYAKYSSSTVNSKQTYYTFNLYGALGDIFQTLLDCVVDENKLTDEQKAESDGGEKYIIKSLWEERLINKEFVSESWSWRDIDFDNFRNPHNCVGMAPAYRGLYSEFESTSALGLGWNSILDGALPTEVKSIEDQLKSRWRGNLINAGYTAEKAEERVDALDYGMIVPNGITEHQIGQFRSYEQKPYIYAPVLFKLYQDKCEELTGYKINLDRSWFSPNNPYYSNLCYMFDYLSIKGNTLAKSLPFTGYTEKQFTSKQSGYKDIGVISNATYIINDSKVLAKDEITIKPFTIGIRQVSKKRSDHTDYSKCKIKLEPFTEILVQVQITSNNNIQNVYFWGATGTLGETSALSSPDSKLYTSENFIQMSEDTKYDATTDNLIGTGYITVPSFKIDHTSGNPITIKYIVTMNCTNQGNNSIYSGRYAYGTEFIKYMRPELNNSNYYVVYPNVEYDTNWRNSTTCALKNLYTKDEPLFNVLLQYTKMMGLIWKVDYQNKVIDIMPRSKYFNDYTVVDWNDKIDKSKGLTIEPVSFSSKYVTFNYDDVEGYHYSGYKQKYGVDYGEKKIRTKYNFDTNETELFKDNKLHPSSISCKSFATVNNLRSWNTLDSLPLMSSEVNFMDCENDDQTESISINNWYFRGPNKQTTWYYYICDVSPIELEQDKYFWVGPGMSDRYGVATMINYLPQFTPVYKSDVNGLTFGCLFNCPNEDYTYDNQVVTGKDHYIYDICWADYINERYNANNKKVTCYVNLSPIDFEQFNYKTFVVIDNQLFVVNKIFDYDVKNLSTKVELIQVTNINGYTKQRVVFPEVSFGTSELRITTDDNYNGATGIKVRSFPVVEYGDVELNYVSRGSSNSWCYIEDTEYDGNTTYFYITYESDGHYTEEWDLEINKFGETYTIPIYIN